MSSALAGPFRCAVTASVLQVARYSVRSDSRQLRRISRSVSAITSAIQRLHPAEDRVDAIVDMLEVGAKAEDGAAQVISAIDAGAAEHHPPLLLNLADQALVIVIHITALGQIAEGDDREVGRRTWIEAVDLRQARMEIAGERELLGLRRAEGGDAGDLQRQPQAQRTEVARELGREVRRR